MLLLPIVMQAQKKGDNKIFAKTPISMTNLKSILFDNGYSVINDDTIFISTTAKELKGPTIVKMMFVRTDSGVYVKGLKKPAQSVELWGVKTESDFEMINYIPSVGLGSKSVKEPFNEIDRIAKIISDTVVYSKN